MQSVRSIRLLGLGLLVCISGSASKLAAQEPCGPRNGDLDGDGIVNVDDFGVFAQAYLSRAGDPNYELCADFDRDGYIDVADFTVFAGPPPPHEKDRQPLPAPPTGACCFENAICLVVSQLACWLLGGEYQGDGTVCARLVELTFSGTGFRNVAKDSDGTDYATPHWKDADEDGYPENAFPVAYVRNTKPTVTATFKLDKAITMNGVVITGEGPDGLTFTHTVDIAGTDTVTITVESDTALPNTVREYEPFGIQWSSSLADPVLCTVSENVMYVTYGNPLGLRLESYFDIGTKAADGQDRPQDIIDAIWDEFKDRNVVNVRGERLGYYRGILCPPDLSVYTAAKLVVDTNGQCGAWADLLRQCFRTQGIGTAKRVTIRPRFAALPRDCDGKRALGFLVKNYAFAAGPGTSGCADYPFRFNDPCGTFGAWAAAEVSDDPGIAGQDEANPASCFGMHYIVKINFRYYDPSYGVGPFTGTKEQANLAWEQGAIDGYCGRAKYVRPKWYLGVRKDRGSMLETNFNR